MSTSSSLGFDDSFSVECLSIPFDTFTRSNSELRALSRGLRPSIRKLTVPKLRIYHVGKAR